MGMNRIYDDVDAEEPVTVTLDFSDLQPVEIPFAWAGKHHVLTEASADAKVKWQNAQMRATRTTGQGEDMSVVGFDGLADVEPLLVSRCLYNCDPNKPGELPILKGSNPPVPDERMLVPLKHLLAWPDRVVTRLYDAVLTASDLKKVDTVDSLTREISKLQRRRDKLLTAAEAANGHVPGPGQFTKATPVDQLASEGTAIPASLQGDPFGGPEGNG